MGQIVLRNQKPKYCNLAAIQDGGSKANVKLDNGEIWLVDTTNSSKINGSGKYDSYIKGDGNNLAKNLVVNKIDNIPTTDNAPTNGSTNPVQSNGVYQALEGKQNVIDDLVTIRNNAATGATAYQLPSSGIPSTDMTAAVQTSLSKADTAAQQSTTYTKTEINNLIVPANTEISVVSALPASGTANTIYRVAGTTSYSDYGWDGTQFVKLAEYDNLIDDEPTTGSANLVKSGGVQEALSKIEMQSCRELKIYPVYPYNIAASGKYGTSSDYCHTAIPVNEGEIYYITSKSTNMRYCFATASDYTSGGNISLLNGTSVIGCPTPDTYYRVKIPAGCLYLIANIGAGYRERIFKVTDINIPELDGESAIVRVINGGYLHKSGYWETYNSYRYRAIVYDVTNRVGINASTTVGYSRINNAKQYQIVKDYTTIGTSADENFATDNLLVAGSNTSTPSEPNEKVSLSFTFTNEAVVAQAAVGKVYLIVNLHKDQDPDEWLMSGTLLDKLLAKQDTLTFDSEPIANSINPIYSGAVYNEFLKVFGGAQVLNSIYSKSGYVYNGNVVGTSVGYWEAESGWTSYVYDITEYRGKQLSLHGACRSQSYRYIFCEDYQVIPQNLAAYNADTTLWTDNIVEVYSGRGVSGNVAFNRTVTVPNTATYLILAEYTSVTTKAAAEYILRGVLDVEEVPTEDSKKLVESGGVYTAIYGYDGHLTPLATHDGLINHNGGKTSTNYGYWAFKSGDYTSYIFDVEDYVGEEIEIRYCKRANSVAWCFLTDWEQIPNEKDLEAFDALKVVWMYSTSTDTGKLYSYTYTVPSGAKHLVVAGKDSIGSPSKAIIPSISTPPSWQPQEESYDYVNNEKKRIISAIQKHCNKDTIIFGFNTDQHVRQTGKSNYTYPVTRGLNALRDIAEQVPFNLICLGGDAAGYSTEELQSEIDADILDVIKAVDTNACPVVFISGNHDAGQNLYPQWDAADGYSMFNTCIKRNVVRRQLDGYDRRSTNCWFDDEANKVRFIFVDAWARANGPRTGAGKTYTAMEANLTEALNDSKLLNSDWSVIIFSHNVFAANVTGNAYDNMPATYWDSYVKPKIDAGMNVIACFNGHAHYDKQGVKDNHLFICSQQAAVQESNESFDGITYSRVIETAEETSYDVFVVEKDSKKIYAYKYGAGMDRLFYYGIDNPRIMLCNLSGVVTVDGAPASGSVFAKHHNTEYECVLGSNGEYNFPYLCPECDWELSFEDHIEIYTATEGTITHNITITS